MANILVCDDDKAIVEAIEIYLVQEGYRVFKAYDGIGAIRILEKEEIHLLIVDVMMPKMDGIHATLKIREKYSIPIIILSAKSEDADKILGLWEFNPEGPRTIQQFFGVTLDEMYRLFFGS